MKSSQKSFQGCTPHKKSKNPGLYEHWNICLYFKILKKIVQLADTTYSGKCYPKKITEKGETVKSSGLCANGAGFAEDRL